MGRAHVELPYSLESLLREAKINKNKVASFFGEKHEKNCVDNEDSYDYNKFVKFTVSLKDGSDVELMGRVDEDGMVEAVSSLPDLSDYNSTSES